MCDNTRVNADAYESEIERLRASNNQLKQDLVSAEIKLQCAESLHYKQKEEFEAAMEKTCDDAERQCSLCESRILNLHEEGDRLRRDHVRYEHDITELHRQRDEHFMDLRARYEEIIKKQQDEIAECSLFRKSRDLAGEKSTAYIMITATAVVVGGLVAMGCVATYIAFLSPSRAGCAADGTPEASPSNSRAPNIPATSSIKYDKPVMFEVVRQLVGRLFA